MEKNTAAGSRAFASTRSDDSPVDKARDVAASSEMAAFTRVGYGAKGLVYIIIGGLAVLAANNAGGSMTDNSGAVQTVAAAPFGRLLLGGVTLGLSGYALWYLLRGLIDLDRKGAEPKALAIRAVFVFVGVSYLLLVFGSIQLLLGFGDGATSSDNTAKDWTARLLEHGWGAALVVIGGLIVLGTAFFQFHQAFTADFKKNLDLTKIPSQLRAWVVRLGRFGLASRGVVYLVISAFLIFAATYRDPSQVKGIAGALTFVAQQPQLGLFAGSVCALGFFAYGLFSLAQAWLLRLDQLRD